MPVESQAQNRFMHAKAKSPGRIGDVAREFVSASHGMAVKKLPQHVHRAKAAHVAEPPRLPAFGSLSGAGHYMGDVPE